MQPGDVLESFADIDRSIKQLNYNPKIDIESGIPLFIDWYNNYTSK
jgi:UDP-glucuronate 4-epimerase